MTSISVRVTPAERAAIESAARSANQTIAQYIRSQVLGAAPQENRKHSFDHAAASAAAQKRWKNEKA